MPNQSGKIVLVLVLMFLILGGAAYFFSPILKKEKQSDQVFNSSTPFPEIKEGLDYYSKNLKIKFQIPEGMKVEEKFTNIKITDSSGEVSVNFNGTNFENIRDHYENLKTKNKLNPKDYEEGKLGDYEYIMTLSDDPGNELKSKKTYFIYTDNRVYIFSTSNEVLYPVLDQIVQSFEYKGNP